MQKLIENIRTFARNRDWEQFHSPKNLAMALSVEVAEIVEHFQWLTQEQSKRLDPEKMEKIHRFFRKTYKPFWHIPIRRLTG